jgi:hypothetical protein
LEQRQQTVGATDSNSFVVNLWWCNVSSPLNNNNVNHFLPLIPQNQAPASIDPLQLTEYRNCVEKKIEESEDALEQSQLVKLFEEMEQKIDEVKKNEEQKQKLADECKEQIDKIKNQLVKKIRKSKIPGVDCVQLQEDEDSLWRSAWASMASSAWTKQLPYKDYKQLKAAFCGHWTVGVLEKAQNDEVRHLIEDIAGNGSFEENLEEFENYMLSLDEPQEVSSEEDEKLLALFFKNVHTEFGLEVYDFKGNLVNLIDEYDAQIEIKIIRRWSEDEQSQYHSLHLRSELEKTVNGEAQIKPLANYLKSTKPTVSFRKSSQKNQSKAEEPIKSDAFQKFGNNLKQQK